MRFFIELFNIRHRIAVNFIAGEYGPNVEIMMAVFEKAEEHFSKNRNVVAWASHKAYAQLYDATLFWKRHKQVLVGSKLQCVPLYKKAEQHMKNIIDCLEYMHSGSSTLTFLDRAISGEGE